MRIVTTAILLTALAATPALASRSTSTSWEGAATESQKQGAELFFGHGASWGMGGAVVTRRTDIFTTPGRFGWDGGYGTSAHLDSAEDMIGVLMTQRMMESPTPPKVFRDFWTGAYQAFDD